MRNLPAGRQVPNAKCRVLAVREIERPSACREGNRTAECQVPCMHGLISKLPNAECRAPSAKCLACMALYPNWVRFAVQVSAPGLGSFRSQGFRRPIGPAPVGFVSHCRFSPGNGFVSSYSIDAGWRCEPPAGQEPACPLHSTQIAKWACPVETCPVGIRRRVRLCCCQLI